MDKESSNPSYREFMRARRPQLYSDTLHAEVGEMDRRQFEYHLQSLTSRKEETAFENFARVLAEKEPCPNLIQQTGPTGGGDSKADTETYPVAQAIMVLPTTSFRGHLQRLLWEPPFFCTRESLARNTSIRHRYD